MAENEGRGRESAVPSVLKRLQEASLPKEKASRCADILADAKKSEKRAEELAAAGAVGALSKIIEGDGSDAVRLAATASLCGLVAACADPGMTLVMASSSTSSPDPVVCLLHIVKGIKKGMNEALRGVLADTGLSSALVRALPIALDLPPPSSAPASTAPGPACNEPVAAVLLATLWALCDMNPEICSAVMGMDPDTSDPSPDTGADTAESKPTGTGSAASHTVAAMLAAAAAPGAPESVRVQAFNAVGSLCLCGANAAPFLRVLPSLADALNAPLPDARRVALAALDAASQLLGDASAAAEARSVGVLRRAATLARLPSSDGASPDPDSLQVARRALNALASAASSGAGSLHAVASLPGALDAAVAALRPRVFAPWAFADEKEKKDEKEEKKGDGLRQRGGGRVEAATEGSEGGKGADSDAGDSSDGDAFRSWARDSNTAPERLRASTSLMRAAAMFLELAASAAEERRRLVESGAHMRLAELMSHAGAVDQPTMGAACKALLSLLTDRRFPLARKETEATDLVRVLDRQLGAMRENRVTSEEFDAAFRLYRELHSTRSAAATSVLVAGAAFFIARHFMPRFVADIPMAFALHLSSDRLRLHHRMFPLWATLVAVVSFTSGLVMFAARTVAVRAAIGVIVWVTLVILAWLSRAGTAWNTALASGLGALTLQLVLQAAVGRTTAAAFMFAGVFFAEVAL